MTEAHLNAELLAGYLDGALSASDSDEVEHHLDQCRACRDELAELSATLSSTRSRVRRRLIAPGVAATAAAAAIAWLALGTGTPPADAPGRTLRDATTSAAPLSSRMEAGSEEVELHWESAAPGATYRVLVSDSVGRPVWSADLTDTTAVLATSDAGIASGAFWLVDALLPDGSTRTTGSLSLSR